MSEAWLEQRERGSERLMAALAWVTLNLGRTFGRLFLPAISLYFLLFARAPRNASRAYLARVFGRPPALRELYRHIHTFAATIHDRTYLLAGRLGEFSIEVQGEGEVAAALREGRGCVLLGAHLGSFECSVPWAPTPATSRSTY